MEGLQQQHRRLPRKLTSNGSRATAAEDAFAGGRTGSKWSNPPKPNDYAEIFGSLATSCSIPVLDLPPVCDEGFATSSRNSTLDYLDIFGGFRTGDFGASYDELFPIKSDRKEAKPVSSNKERFSKEKGSKLRPTLFSGSVKDQIRSNAASIKTDQSSNHKVSQNPSSRTTNTGSQTAKEESRNESMQFYESSSVSAVTFSIDPHQVPSRKNDHSSVPASHANENEVSTVAETNLNASSPSTSLHNRMHEAQHNEARDEVMCNERPSLAEVAVMEDNHSNEQYHSCSSSDQSTLEGEELTSDLSKTNNDISYQTTEEVTVESHPDKTALFSPSSSCAIGSQNSLNIKQPNITEVSKAPQTPTSVEGLHSKVTNNQFPYNGEGKLSVADLSPSHCTHSPDMIQQTTKEDVNSNLPSNTKVPECEFEVGQKQFQHVDSASGDQAANGRHLTHLFSSVSSPTERKFDTENKFLTVLDINLRTVPCAVPPPSRPPPSRPPPKPASIQGHTVTEVQMKNIVNGSSETEVLTATKGGQPDVEDTGSAAAVSIAVKEAVEQAAAKFKIAKESMERKKDYLQQRKKLGKCQEKEREVTDSPQLAQSSEHDRLTENCSCKCDDTVNYEKMNATYSDIFARECNSAEGVKQNAHDKVSDINQSSCMQDENIGTWKIEEQFVELVNGDKSFKKVKELSDNNTSSWPKRSDRVVDGNARESETCIPMPDENYAKLSHGAHPVKNADLLEVSEAHCLEEINGRLQEDQLLGQVKKADDYSSTSYSDILAFETGDTAKKELNSCQDKENEVPQKDSGVQSFELKIPITDKHPDLSSVSEDENRSGRDSACEETESKVDFNEKQIDSSFEMHQSDEHDYVVFLSETNCKSDADEMNLRDPEPVEFPENSKEPKKPSVSRVRKKWSIPKFSEGSILATEEVHLEGGKEGKGRVSEVQMAMKQDGPKILNDNLVACESLKDFGNGQKKHKSDAVEEHSSYPDTDQELATDEANWQYFCEKIIKETQEEPEYCGMTKKVAEMQAESNVYEEEPLDGPECKKTQIKDDSASSFQDASNRCYAADAANTVESDMADDGMEEQLFKRPGNTITSSEETTENQNLEEIVNKLSDDKGKMQEERVSEDGLKRDIEKKLEGERGRERQRKVEEEIERENERRLEEEREREREREKDRQAVERAIRESRERAERAAVERVTAEARQRALAEAREKAEKASAEALLQAEKASREARLRAERTAVERATAEARERAAERALAEKAAQEAKERSNSTAKDWNKREVNVEGIAKVGLKDEPGVKRSVSSSDLREPSHEKLRYSYSSNSVSCAPDKVGGNEGETAIRCKARLERHQRTVERAAKALAEKNMRDILAQREQAERNRLAEILDAEVRRWSSGKDGNLRALLSTLQYILGPDSGWQPVPLTEVITAAAVKKAYRKATLCVHPDKLQQRGASIQQKYICEKVFDLLKEAWNRFNSEER